MLFLTGMTSMTLKAFTRQKRQGWQVPVAYHVTDTTSIAKIQMTCLLSHMKTKVELSELTAYLAERFTRKGSLRAETSIDGGIIRNQVCGNSSE